MNLEDFGNSFKSLNLQQRQFWSNKLSEHQRFFVVVVFCENYCGHQGELKQKRRSGLHSTLLLLLTCAGVQHLCAFPL